MWRSYLFIYFFFSLDLIVNAYLNTNTSHLGAFGRKAGPPCNTNPLSPSGKSLSQRSYMDFPKLTHEKKKILRTFYFGGGFLQSRRRSGNNYSDTPPPPQSLKAGALLTDSTGRSESSCSEPPQSRQSRYSPSSRMCCCPSKPGSL